MKKLRNKTLSSVFVLVSVISASHAQAGSASKRSDIDVFAGSIDSIERLERGGQPIAFLHDRPVISHSSIELLKADDKSLTIDFKVAKDEVKVMNSFLEKYPDKRMAFVTNGKLLFAPAIKTRLTGEAIQISFKDRSEYQEALEALAPARQ